jgi:hypothetical protein
MQWGFFNAMQLKFQAAMGIRSHLALVVDVCASYIVKISVDNTVDWYY